MTKLFVSLLVLSAFLISCDKKKDAPAPETINQKLSGTWVRQKTYVCAGVNWTDSGIDHSLTFTEKNYSRDIQVQGVCGAKRTGLYSMAQNQMTLGYSTIVCDSANLCPADFHIQQGSETKTYNFDCPGVLKTDGQVFIIELRDNHLILTPRDGLDKGCSYTYTKAGT